MLGRQLFILSRLPKRAFASQVLQSGRPADNFSFPRHKEFFNDEYYDPEGEDQGTMGKFGGQTNPFPGQDYEDPNNPF
jgi:hypothetical protein